MLKNITATTAITLGILFLVALLVVPTILVIGLLTPITLIETCLLFLCVSSVANLVGRIARW